MQLYSEDGTWAVGHRQSTDAVAGKHRSTRAITGFRAPRDGAAVLDVGCGHGRWLNTFQQYGWKTFGIDPALKSAFRHMELTAIPPDARFDFVVLSHVLEHVPNPGELLAAVGRATRPGAGSTSASRASTPCRRMATGDCSTPTRTSRRTRSRA